MQKGIKTVFYIWSVTLIYIHDPTAEMQKGIKTFPRDIINNAVAKIYDPTAEMQKGIKTSIAFLEEEEPLPNKWPDRRNAKGD